jgi:hypothetical protein
MLSMQIYAIIIKCQIIKKNFIKSKLLSMCVIQLLA